MAPRAPINESILSTSAVYLFGRLISDITVVRNDPDEGNRPDRVGQNNFLKNQLKAADSGLARIFGFSFEGTFYEMGRPAVFLVHGPGLDPDAPPPGLEGVYRLARSPGRVTRTGVARHFGAFAMDVRVWVYDKGDFSLRLDVETGTFEDILLAIENSAEGGFARSSGARSSGARSSGALARSSGVMARSSGWMPKRSGDLD